MQVPRRLHATAAPTVALLDVYNKTYPRLTRAETPEARPSAPSKKLKALMNSTTKIQVTAASRRGLSNNLRPHGRLRDEETRDAVSDQPDGRRKGLEIVNQAGTPKQQQGDINIQRLHEQARAADG